jgi:transcriptional regulator with XRE-family HTH domain
MSFTDRLLDLIKEKGITTKKFLLDLDVNKNAMINWTKRGSTPNGEILKRMADYFDVSVDFLLGKTDIKKSATGKDDGLIDVDPRVAEIKQIMSQMSDDEFDRFYAMYRVMFGKRD